MDEYNLKLPFLKYISAPRGSGKTYLLINLLTNENFYKGKFDKIIFVCPSFYQDPKYSILDLPDNQIFTEFDVKNWNTFLPPLKPIKVFRLHDVDPSFKNDLTRMFEMGNAAQFEKISELKSKIFYFSLHIQELIQRVY